VSKGANLYAKKHKRFSKKRKAARRRAILQYFPTEFMNWLKEWPPATPCPSATSPDSKSPHR
jgi:hypothetical protein